MSVANAPYTTEMIAYVAAARIATMGSSWSVVTRPAFDQQFSVSSGGMPMPNRVDAAAQTRRALLELPKPACLGDAFRDADELSLLMPADIPAPSVWTDGATEVVFEWNVGALHAAITLEGDGEYGCTMLNGDRFVPSRADGLIASGFPADLAAYLRH